VSTLSGYGFGAFGSLLVPICLMAMHKNPCTAKNADTMQEGQGTVFLLFLQQLFFVIPVHHSEDDCINQLHDFTSISELEHWSF
jgi:hypothetical protein